MPNSVIAVLKQPLDTGDLRDVGRCDLIPHEIMVFDVSPVHSAYRRMPPHLAAEVKQLFQGLIRRSSSNYASAVVLVKKKSGALRSERAMSKRCASSANR